MAMKENIQKKSVWLHNIRSVYNVGSMFRTADAIGVQQIYLSGYTPLPIDRFGRAREDFAKVALGAEKSVPWVQLKNPFEEIRAMQEKGAYLIGIEQDEHSVDIFSFPKPEEVSEMIIAMGEETLGMEAEQLALCDTILEIPMHGQKESLNVSVAFGIASYCIWGK